MAGGRHTTRGVDHDPHRRTHVGEARIAHGQRWVVGDRRPRAHDDGVGPGAEPLHVGTRRLARDPSGGAVGRRGLAVEARRHLQGDVRKAARDVTFERPVEAPRLGGHRARVRPRCRRRGARRGRACPRPGSDRWLPRPRAPPPRRSGRGCRAGCDRSGCTARACRPRWPLASGLRLRPAPSPRRARCRALRASPRRAPSRRDRRRRGRPPWDWETRGPSRVRRARAPAASGSVVLSPRAASFGPAEAWRMASVRRCDSRRAHSAARSSRSPVPFHPDSHGRSRNSTGSTHRWLRQGRGLSPPVGSCTPPRKRLVVCRPVYGARERSR